MLVSPLKRLSVVLGILFITGCGFQLRGSSGLPAALSPLHISEQNSVLRQSLVSQFEQADIHLTPNRENARWRLWLSPVRHNKQQTTYSSGSISYELQAEVDYQLLTTTGQAISTQQTLRAVKTYNSNSNLFSEESDINALRMEMERDLASRISRQIGRLTLPSVQAQ